MRPRRAGPWLPVALLALAGLGSIALAQVSEDDFLPERETTCWPCHLTWAPPLRSMYNIVPPPSVDAKPGEPFEYSIRIENPWLAALTYVEPSISLARAPSLRFASGSEPFHDEKGGSVSPDPTQPQAERTAFVVTEIPSGATSLTITLEPTDASGSGPDLALRLYPGKSAPSGTPAAIVDTAGPGGAETYEVPSATELSRLGYGNWSIEAAMAFVSAGGLVLPVQPAGFSVTVDAGFEATGQMRQFLTTRETLDAGKSMLFTWQLEAAALPGPGEVVEVLVNGTAYYDHSSSANDDEANFTKAMEISVLAAGDVVRLEPMGDFIPPRPQVAKLSMARVSEVVGYVSGFLLLSSVWSGGMFGKASRRGLNTFFGSAKRRVAFHNFLSYGILLAAAVHTVLFIIEEGYHWTIGLLWGGLGILAFAALGVTGAWQVALIRRWNYPVWRWTHYGLAVAAIVFTLVHMFLDGANLEQYTDSLGWNDPFVPDEQEGV